MPATSLRGCYSCHRRSVANPAQGVDACDVFQRGESRAQHVVANPAQGVDACDRLSLLGSMLSPDCSEPCAGG